MVGSSFGLSRVVVRNNQQVNELYGTYFLNPRELQQIYLTANIPLKKNQAKEGQNEPLNRKPAREELLCINSGETASPISGESMDCQQRGMLS